MRSFLSTATRRRSSSSTAIPAGARALRAIAVATPPGWTTVTPTRVPSSSWRSAFEKPRTANLLAEYALCPAGATMP